MAMNMILPAPTLETPHEWKGMRVGIFGGSFNPPHAGHMHVAKIAIEHFKLDALWWMVSPANPLKEGRHMPNAGARLELVQKLLEGTQERMVATDIEIQMGTCFSYDTVVALRKNFKGTEFIWIAGMDCAENFHLWKNWQELPLLMPFAFFARPLIGASAGCERLKNTPSIPQHMQFDGTLRPGVYWRCDTEMLDISSTALRDNAI